jgi:hypothetical protein
MDLLLRGWIYGHANRSSLKADTSLNLGSIYFLNRSLRFYCGYSASRFPIVLCTFNDRSGIVRGFLGLEPEVQKESRKLESHALWLVKYITKLLSNHHINHTIYFIHMFTFQGQQTGRLKKDKKN